MSSNPYESPAPEFEKSSHLHGGTSVAPFASAHVVALVTCALLLVYACLCAISFALVYGHWAWLNYEMSDFTIRWATEFLRVNDRIVQVRLIVFGCTAAFFLFWFHRAYRNLPALGATRLSFSPAGAVACWFIPLVNLGRPFLVASEIWRASDPALTRNLDTRWRNSSHSWLVMLWWASTLVTILLFAIGPQASQEMFQGNIKVMFAGLRIDALKFFTATLSAVLVFAINRRQEQKYQKRLRQGEPLVAESQPA